MGKEITPLVRASFPLQNSVRGNPRRVEAKVLDCDYKENSEFKPVKLRLKIDLVSYPARAEGLGKYGEAPVLKFGEFGVLLP